MASQDVTSPPNSRRSTASEGSYLEPFSRLHEEMDRLFDDFLPKIASSRLLGGRGGLVPLMDVSESEDAVEVKADLPGMEEKDIDVRLSNGLLVVSGERKEEKEEKKKNYYRAERRYGSFSRSATLPCEVDEERVEAKFKDGVLTVTLPKSEKAKKSERKISITKS